MNIHADIKEIRAQLARIEAILVDKSEKQIVKIDDLYLHLICMRPETKLLPREFIDKHIENLDGIVACIERESLTDWQNTNKILTIYVNGATYIFTEKNDRVLYGQGELDFHTWRNLFQSFINTYLPL